MNRKITIPSAICVRIMRHVVSAMFLAGIVFASGATWPAGYYNSLEGKKGADLQAAVKALALKGKKTIEYGTNTWNAFLSTDIKTVGGVDYWWDMYSPNLVKVSSGHPDMNIEHSVANSWWGKSKNEAYKDIVHLNPSDAEANNRKGNFPLAEISGTPTWTNGVTNVGKPVSGQGGGSGSVYEPHDDYKGDFARVFMYMFVAYDDISWASKTNWMYSVSGGKAEFRTWAKELLLRWSDNDPVSEKERSRNDGIQTEQNNRNPFIDLPDLAEYIWGSKVGQAYSLGGTPVDPGNDPVTPDDPSEKEVIYRWLPQGAGAMDNDWSIEDIKLPSGSDHVWAWDTQNGAYLKGSAFIGGKAQAAESYAWSPVVDLTHAESVSFSFDHAAKYQTTLQDECFVAVRDVQSGSVTPVGIGTWPSSGNWTFVNSGLLDLSAHKGHKVQVGFHYGSTTSGADTWEVRNAVLTVRNSTATIVEDFDDPQTDDSFLVEVWGNNILVPGGARIFDLRGREFSGENLAPGIYVVVKPTFRSAVKVLIK